MFVGCSRLRRAERVFEIEKGMTEAQVIEIMGKPDEVFAYDHEEDFYRFMYDAPFAYSDNVYVFFSTTDSTVVGYNDGL